MKSGTSSLYSYLIRHPKVCKSIVKEPEFFSENQGHGAKADKYEDLWDFDPKTHQIALEASTGYTKYPFEKNVPKNIFDYGLNPKFIYIVRNPIDRIISQYHFVKNNPKWDDHDIISEETISFSSYFLQLSQYRKYFSKDRILIVDFKDLSENPIDTTNKVFDFLEIDRKSFSDYPAEHKTKIKGKLELSIQKRFSPVIRLFPYNFSKRMQSLLFKSKKKKILSENELSTLKSKLSKDMNKFKVEYNFDVSKWGF